MSQSLLVFQQVFLHQNPFKKEKNKNKIDIYYYIAHRPTSIKPFKDIEFLGTLRKAPAVIFAAYFSYIYKPHFISILLF